MSEILPNFLVIGAQRCATSWLYFCLREHPEVYVPYIKEVGFFNRSFDKGLRWYERYFEMADGKKAIGEVTPSYIYREGTAERIARTLPGVKLVVIFRNPIERAYSQYRKHVRGGSIALSFEEALARNSEYVERGFYYTQLSRYRRLFNEQQLRVLIYEDVQKEPKRHLREIFRYLGVDEHFVPPSVASIIPSEALASGLYGPVSRISSLLRRRMKLGFLIDSIKRTPVRAVMDRALTRFGPKADGKKTGNGAGSAGPSPATRERLYQIFKPEIEQLQQALRRDLGFWR